MTDQNQRGGLRLKPCPFCGRQPRSGFNGGSDETGEEYGYFYAECCDTYIHRDSELEMHGAWNRRIDSAASQPNERLATLAAFIRNQCGLVTLKGGKVVEGVGDVHLNNEEALLCADALSRAAPAGEQILTTESPCAEGGKYKRHDWQWDKKHRRYYCGNCRLFRVGQPDRLVADLKPAEQQSGGRE